MYFKKYDTLVRPFTTRFEHQCDVITCKPISSFHWFPPKDDEANRVNDFHWNQWRHDCNHHMIMAWHKNGDYLRAFCFVLWQATAVLCFHILVKSNHAPPAWLLLSIKHSAPSAAVWRAFRGRLQLYSVHSQVSFPLWIKSRFTMQWGRARESDMEDFKIMRRNSKQQTKYMKNISAENIPHYKC